MKRKNKKYKNKQTKTTILDDCIFAQMVLRRRQSLADF